MKKLITILLIFQSTLTFSQVGESLSVFSEESEYFKASRLMIKCIQNDWNFNAWLETKYSFRANGNLFLLSYEHQEDYRNNIFLKYKKGISGAEKTRKIYLYKLDYNTLTWSIASDVIKTDYFRCDEHGNNEYSYYYSEINDLSDAVSIRDGVNQGSVNVLDNGNVEIVLIYFERKFGEHWTDDDYKWVKIKLIPTKDNFYKVK